MSENEYEPSPDVVVREQVALYEATDGREGSTRGGYPNVILTMRGRKTGKIRKAPVVTVKSEGTYAAVASMGGAPKNPYWYDNLYDGAVVHVQDLAQKFSLTARRIDAEERGEWWERAVAVFPTYAEYQLLTDRQIPIVLLEPNRQDS